MNAEPVEAAFLTWDRAAAAERAGKAEELRQQFVERYPLEGWADLPIEAYALGLRGEEKTICWWLEFGTRPSAAARESVARV